MVLCREGYGNGEAVTMIKSVVMVSEEAVIPQGMVAKLAVLS